MGGGPEDKEIAMKCMHCAGRLEKAFSSYTVDRNGYHLFIEKIPAYVCERCGERSFDESEVVAIQSMLTAFEEKLEKVRVAA